MWAVRLQSVRPVGPTGLRDQSDRPVGPTIVPCKRPVTRTKQYVTATSTKYVKHMVEEVLYIEIFQASCWCVYSLVNLDVRKFSFSQRVINHWNALTQHAVDCNTVNSFKRCVGHYITVSPKIIERAKPARWAAPPIS